jgi:PAS domain S-box-containing protein
MSAAIPSTTLRSFLDGGGETAELIARRDWSGTPLGPISQWPATLKITLGTLLHSPVPMVLLWGPAGIMLYNDAYSLFAGWRHPQLLGSEVRIGWPEAADFNDNVMKVVLAGGTLVYRDQELTLHRKGIPEQVWMNLDYSPVYDEAGEPAGVLAIVVETTARVLAERQIAVEHRRLTEMCEQAPGMMAIFEGPEHRFVLANAVERQLIGREDILGRTVREVMPEVEDQGFLELLDRVYETGQPYHGTAVPVKLARSSGKELETRYLNFVFQPLRDAAGTVNGIFVEGFDVTDERKEVERRTRAEIALRDRERELRLLTDAMPVLISYIGSDKRFQFVNLVYEGWFGLPRDKIQGALVRDILGAQMFSKVEPMVDRALSGERVSFEQHMPYPGGERYIRADYVPRVDDSGNVIGIYTLVEDITRAKKAQLAIQASETKLRQSEERLRLASEAAGLGAHDYDVQNGTIYWSSGIRLIAGVPGEGDLEFGDVLKTIHPADRDRIEAEMVAIARRAAPYELEFRVRQPDGQDRWVLDRGEAFGPIDEATGKVSRIMGVLIDISERKRSEDRIRLLMREVNHRSKNLLSVVQAVARQTVGYATAETFADRFVERLQGLAASHDLLLRNSWEGVDLEELIRSQLSYLRDMVGTRIVLRGSKVWLTPAAGQTLGMALHELATNAAKYGSLSTQDGTVTISWSVGADKEQSLFTLAWKEAGGPLVAPPVRRGFGSLLLSQITARAVEGKIDQAFDPGGLTWTLEAPISAITS